MKPIPAVSHLCDAIRELQRQRVCNLKSRIMISNRLVATVATATGYHAGMEDDERKKRFAKASEVIARVKTDHNHETDSGAGLILATLPSIAAFDAMVDGYEKEMLKLAKQLPVAAWVAKPEQRGFGLHSLALIVGETGDLNNYAAPGKLWKRMGCAPYESHGEMKMPSTWRKSKPTLSAEEWTEIGYSPRRRSVAYLIGEGLMKQNFLTNGKADEYLIETDLPDATSRSSKAAKGAGKSQRETEPSNAGPYRRRYDEAKARAVEVHPDWCTPCETCKGKGKNKRGDKCSKCNGNGKAMAHAHNHAMLLCAKLLLKNLWVEWTGGDEVGGDTDTLSAPALCSV